MRKIERHFKKTDWGVKQTARARRMWEELSSPCEMELLRESLEEGDLEAMLEARGMSLCCTIGYLNRAHGETRFAYGPIAIGEEEVVVTELMIMPDPQDVAYFIERMDKFPTHVPFCNGKNIYGAVAYLNESEPVQAYAERQGLFVIRATDDCISIVNDEQFQPRAFGPASGTTNSGPVTASI